jgi:phosphate-selective porin OprO and OprP
MSIQFIKSTWLHFLAAALSTLFLAGALPAAEVPDEELKLMRQRIQEMEERMKRMEQEQNGSKTPAAETAKTAPTVKLGDNGLVVHSPHSNFVSYLHGYVQVDGRFYPDDPGTPRDTLLLRRVRPILEGTVYKQFDYRLMADLGSGVGTSSTAGNNAFINDAYVNARWCPDFQTQIGKFKSPIGLERLASVADLPFIETGFPTQLTPNYDLGVEVHNSLFNSPIAYAVGFFNGAMDAASDDQDVSDTSKDVAGRLFAQPFLHTENVALRHLGFGAGGSIGQHSGTLPSYRTPGQQTLFSYAKGISADGLLYRVDPQFFYYWGPFGIQAEYILSSQKVRDTTTANPAARFNNTAWQVEASWFLTGEANRFKPTSLIRVDPVHPFGPGQPAWGAFEVAARVGQIYLDQDASPKYVASNSTGCATSFGIGLNWYLNRNIKFSLDYERTWFHNNNKTTPNSTISRPENAVLTQVQFAF